MLTTTADEIEEGLKAAKNLNSALKNFLKREVGTNEAAARFAKDFRTAASGLSTKMLRPFIDRHHKTHEIFFLAVARHAHADCIGAISDAVVSEYSEPFNETYEKNGQKVTIKDQKNFSRIIQEVSVKIDAGLKAAGLSTTNFMRSAVLLSIFDEDVLAEPSFMPSLAFSK